MNEKLRLFLEKLSEDESLCAKMETIKSPDEAYAIASESVGGGFTKDEFVEVMTSIKEQLENNSDELTLDDLSQISGGMDDGAKASLIAGSCCFGIPLAAACGAAAALCG